MTKYDYMVHQSGYFDGSITEYLAKFRSKFTRILNKCKNRIELRKLILEQYLELNPDATAKSTAKYLNQFKL